MSSSTIIGLVLPILALAVALTLFVTLRHAPRWARAIWPVVLFVGMTVLLAIERVMPLSATPGKDAGTRLLLTVWWVLGGHVVVEISRALMLAQGRSREARLSSDIVAALAYIATLLAVMNFVFDLPVRGLLLTSGVVAVIIGLALQTTLSDVFSGIAVGVEAPFAVGDRIRIDDSFEGEVAQINWRSIHLIVDGNDIATIPNSVIAKARLINRSVPSPRGIVKVEVAFPANVNPDLAIGLQRQALLLCPLALEAPKPTILLTALGQRLARYEVQFSVLNNNTTGAAKDRFLREIHRQFRAEGIGEWGARQGVARVASLGIDFFNLMPPDIQARLIDLTHPIALQSEQILFHEGQTGNSLYVLTSGVLQLDRAVHGASKRLGRIGPGDYIGELGMLTGSPYASTARALVPSTIRELRHTDLKPLLDKEPSLLAVLEASAQHGLKLIEREVAAQANSALPEHGHLIDHIRNFLFSKHHG